MVQDSEESRKKCICLRCPSYPHDCKGEVLYCATGKSTCDIEVKGCICNICPVYHENKLKGLYFCDKEEVGGSRFLMRKKRSDEEDSFYQTSVDIKDMAATGTSVVRSMGALKKLPFSLDDLHFIPAQVHRIPLNREDKVKEKVSWLRKVTDGVPIGAKIGCGNVEKDIQVLVDAGVDFIALDGFGGGTGATEFYVRENVGIPIFAALPRAFRVLTDRGVKNKIAIIAGGGLRTSADFAKCLALGADAVYIGTAALIAINCEQYRICHTGLCPTGVTTHNPALVKQLDVEEGIKKLSNFVTTATQEIANLTRIVGKDDVNKLDSDDLVSMDKDLAVITGTRWLNG